RVSNGSVPLQVAGEWGVGSREGVKEVNPWLPTPHSLLPTPLLHKNDFVAATGVDEFSRRAAPERDLPETRAARIGEQIITIRRLGEIGAESSDLAPPYMDFRRRRDLIRLQLGLGEIG